MRQIIRLTASGLIGGLLIAVGPIQTQAAQPLIPASAPVLRSGADDSQNLPRARNKAHWQIELRGWSKQIRRGGQARIDRCKATLYWGSLPGNSSQPAWLAGHNYCGFWRWDKWLPVGSRFKMTTPTGKVLKYKVHRRDLINRRGGSSAGLIHGDITLQTCRGSQTAFIYARRLN